MLGKVFGLLCFISMCFCVLTGNAQAASGAILDGAGKAVSLTLSLTGTMALWCGVMRAAKAAGAQKALTRIISPLLRLCFPHACRSGHGKDEIAACITANILGIGNAATPLALAAMSELQKDNQDPESATDDMTTLVILNSSAFSLLPTTLITLRRACGSSDPFICLVPVWICSFVCSVLGVTLSRLAAGVSGTAKRRRKRS